MNKEELYNINWDIITDVLKESASKSQEKSFEEWINSDDANSTYFNQIKNVWIKTGSISHLYSEETTLAWERVKNQTINKQHKVFAIKRKVLLPLSIAASLLIALLIGKDILNPKKTSITTSNNISLAYKLPDNSQIDLSYNSKISFNSQYNRRNREVWLNGEAFFDVQKDKNKAFIIHTTCGDFRVLGTSFNISSYENDNLMSLYVKTGLVEFFPENRKGSIKIGKGYQIHFNKDKLSIIKKPHKTENYIAWKTGNLSFKNTKLADVIKTLENTFNTEISLENEKQQELLFTATFNNQSLKKIIQVITITFDLEVENINEKYKFKQKEPSSIQ